MTWNQATVDREKMRFDDAADIYDLYRPGYPEEIIDAVGGLIADQSVSEALEIGAGSGKATACFADSNFHITCVEPGEALAEKGAARFRDNSSISYINRTFEDTEIPYGSLDLIYSAQAFHWVRKPYGYSKMARLLKSGGHAALFWNRYLDDGSELSHRVAKLCTDYGVIPMMPKDRINVINDSQFRELNQCGFFEKVTVTNIPWSRTLSFSEFLGFLQTGNGWLGLDDIEKASLGRALEALFSEAGGIFEQHFICSLFIAQVR